jgi:DNA-directed RNA polymerase specialized sigma24 family protein
MVDETASRYATVTDYHRIFAEEMESLYLLAFLLTADSDKAEQCFVSGLGECVDRIGVFMERARSWARRAVVKHAIRMIRPVPEGNEGELFVRGRQTATATTRNPFAAIVSLPGFERFVFVMSVLEGQSDEECQDFLGCSRLEILMAHEVTFRLVAASAPSSEHTLNGHYRWPTLLH